jgi:hypothetical protein
LARLTGAKGMDEPGSGRTCRCVEWADGAVF